MDESDIRKIVAETVSETLLKLGIDTSEPLELQADMLHVRKQRQSYETVKKQGLVTAIGIITTGILGLIWMALSKGH